MPQIQEQVIYQNIVNQQINDFLCILKRLKAVFLWKKPNHVF